MDDVLDRLKCVIDTSTHWEHCERRHIACAAFNEISRLRVENSELRERDCGWEPGDGPCRAGRDNLCRACELHMRAESAEGESSQMRSAKDGAYAERDRLVAALSKLLPSWLERHPDSDKSWEDDWRWIVHIEGPTGQMTWHIHDSELSWFDHLERSDDNTWDGHTTEEKYARLDAIGEGRDDG